MSAVRISNSACDWREARATRSRSSAALHFLQSSVSLEIIRDFLGHVDVKTTQIYARANLEMKRRALEKVADNNALPDIPSWQQSRRCLIDCTRCSRPELLWMLADASPGNYAEPGSSELAPGGRGAALPRITTD